MRLNDVTRPSRALCQTIAKLLSATLMRRHSWIFLTAACALACVAACSDAAAPSPASAAQPADTSGTSSQQTPPPTGYDAVWMNFVGPALIAGDSVLIRGRVHRDTAYSPDTLAWATSDPSIASIEVTDRNVVLLRALRSGSVAISARTQSARPELTTRLALQVFARSNAVSPIVVDEFAILRTVYLDGSVSYEPKLRLRDTSTAGTAKVIGLAIDVPQIGSSVFCSANRIVGAAGWSAFNPPGDMNYGFWLVPQYPTRVAVPTVRVSAVLSDGAGVSLTATGQTEPAPNSNWYDGEDTGVRCQF